MAIIVTDPRLSAGQGENLGRGALQRRSRTWRKAEYAILVDRAMTGIGLGPMLMRYIIEYARKRGIKELYGEVLRENEPMLRLNRALNFKIHATPDDPGVLHVNLLLN
jgi:acetyltransferase